jgi:hypothetical protein
MTAFIFSHIPWKCNSLRAIFFQTCALELGAPSLFSARACYVLWRVAGSM